MPTTHDRTALILGASGGIGGETARALERHGWTIRALSRDALSRDALSRDALSRGDRPHGPSAWQWVTGDAMDPDSIVRAAEGASVIVHAVNPPGYRNWGQLVLPMLESTLAAARASGARVVLPGTIYNYGPDAWPILREDSPQRATTFKGRVRIQLEGRLERAAEAGVRSLIVRFGDFFGPKPGNSWFSQGLVTPNRPLRSVTYPGRRGVGHTWTYLPDAGETFARLLNREPDLDDFARFHVRGFFDVDGKGMIEAIRRVVGNLTLPVRPLPWFALQLAAPFNETMRELVAVRPLWEAPIELDNSRLVAFLGEEPRTNLDAAVGNTLEGLGVLSTAARA